MCVIQERTKTNAQLNGKQAIVDALQVGVFVGVASWHVCGCG